MEETEEDGVEEVGEGGIIADLPFFVWGEEIGVEEVGEGGIIGDLPFFVWGEENKSVDLDFLFNVGVAGKVVEGGGVKEEEDWGE